MQLIVLYFFVVVFSERQSACRERHNDSGCDEINGCPPTQWGLWYYIICNYASHYKALYIGQVNSCL